MSDFRKSLATGPTVAGSRTEGSDNKVPIIFSHGLFMNREMFTPQVEHFSADFNCITWDERAHGQTTWSGEFTYWDSARDLIAMMDALGIERAVHVGMSQGGLLGMRAALLAPERFVGIVQLASQAGALDEEAAAGFRQFVAGWVEDGATPQLLDFLTNLILGPGVAPQKWHAYWSALTPRQIGDAVSAIYALDVIYDRLPELQLPIAVIHGLADVSTPYPLAERVAREIPDCRVLALIPGGPHAVNLSDPAPVNAAISDFLAAIGLPNKEHAT